jgi:hypothetical protein
VGKNHITYKPGDICSNDTSAAYNQIHTVNPELLKTIIN